MEYVAKRVTPYLRGLVAIELVERGRSQYKVAKMLGISQPMVSKILRAGRRKLLEKLEKSGVPADEAQLVSRLVADAVEHDLFEALKLLSAYEISLIVRGVICSEYERTNSHVPEACKVFDLLQQTADAYIEEAQLAYEKFRKLELAVELVPEVGPNIVVARPGAKSYLDVVGFTGRIVKSDEGVTAVGRPAYGASKHTAKVLLEASKVRSDLRACIVLKRSELLLKALAKAGLKVCSVEGYASEEGLLELVRKAFEKAGGECDAIEARGGIGFEPNVYLFGRSGPELIDELAKALKEVGKGF